MTALVQHLAAAWQTVAELQQLGCNVLSVDVDKWADAPRVQIADPGALLDHIDAMSVDCSDVKYLRMGVRIANCSVFWFLPRPPLETALHRMREEFST
jgi:hypothetical protein